MTITSTTVKTAPLAGNDVTTSWPFAFIAFASTDVGAKIADADGVETTLTNGVDFSVLLNPDQNTSPGGSISYSPALAAGSTIVVYSNVPSTQPTAISNQGNQRPAVTERALDRAMVVINQVLEKFSRTLLFTLNSNITNVVLPPLADGEGWVWDDIVGGLVAAPLDANAVAAAVAATAADAVSTAADAVSTAADAASASASVALLAPITTAMPAYSVVGRNAGTTGAAAAFSLNQKKFLALAVADAYGYALSVGPAQQYTSLATALHEFVERGYHFGSTLDISLTGNTTEGSYVVFPVGIKTKITITGNVTLSGAAGVDLVNNEAYACFYMPKGAWVEVYSAGAYTLTFDCADTSGAGVAPESVVMVDGSLTATGTAGIALTATAGVLKPTYLLSGKSPHIFTASNKITVNNDASSGHAVYIFGGFVGASFVCASSANTDLVTLAGCTLALNAYDGFASITASGCVGTISIAEASTTADRHLLYAYTSVISIDGLGGNLVLASATCNAYLITSVRSDISIDEADFDITAAGASCTRVVDALTGKVVAYNSTFTGQGGDYALYGVNGSELRGSGNTYTTLTASNLNGTWAAGGNYLNA